MRVKLTWIAVLVVALAVLTGCDVQGRNVGFYAQVKLPDGTVANLYAAYQDATRQTGTPPTTAPADAMFYIGSDQCQSIYYQGDITIPQDFSSAVLHLPSTQWGALTVNLTAAGTPMPSAPLPIVCPDTNPNDINYSDPNHITTGVQQYVVGSGNSATGDYTWTIKKKGQPTRTVSGTIDTADIGAYVYDSVFNNPNASPHLPSLPIWHF